MIVTPMKQSTYNFERCKLCGHNAEPRYKLPGCTIYVCKSCDFHFIDQLDDLPAISTSMNLDDKSRHYIESRLPESKHLHLQRLKLIQKYITKKPINSLDIGAGLGQFQLLLKKEGYNCHGIEPSKIRREYAAETFGIDLHSELVDTPFWQGGFPAYFDLITLWDVIEHVNFPRETLQNAVNVLKQGGLLCLETPRRNTIPYRISQTAYRLSGGKLSLFLPTFYSTAPFGHKQIFMPTQLTSLIESFGLQIIHHSNSYAKGLFAGDKIILIAQKL